MVEMWRAVPQSVCAADVRSSSSAVVDEEADKDATQSSREESVVRPRILIHFIAEDPFLYAR